jgi:hypothetical protein
LDSPLSPLYRHPTLKSILQQSEYSAKQIKLSSTFVFWSLSSADSKLFKKLSYAQLELSPDAGSFLHPGFAQPVQSVTLQGRHWDCSILVANPDSCQLKITYFGEPKGSRQMGGVLGAAAAVASAGMAAAGSFLDAVLQKPADFSNCEPIGEPVVVDIVTAAMRGYFSRAEFGSGSYIHGLDIKTIARQYRPAAAAISTQLSSLQQASTASSDVVKIPGALPLVAVSSSSSMYEGVGHGSVSNTPQGIANSSAAAGNLENRDNSNPSTSSDSGGSGLHSIPDIPAANGSSWQRQDITHLQAQLKDYLRELQDSYCVLRRAKDAAKGFTSIADKPVSPDEVEQRQMSSINFDQEREQEQLRCSSHTQLLQQLVQLSSDSSADVQKLLGACCSVLGPTGNRPQGAAAMQAAVQQLCQVLSSSRVPDLALQLRTLNNEVNKGADMQFCSVGFRQ